MKRKEERSVVVELLLGGARKAEQFEVEGPTQGQVKLWENHIAGRKTGNPKLKKRNSATVFWQQVWVRFFWGGSTVPAKPRTQVPPESRDSVPPAAEETHSKGRRGLLQRGLFQAPAATKSQNLFPFVLHPSAGSYLAPLQICLGSLGWFVSGEGPPPSSVAYLNAALAWLCLPDRWWMGRWWVRYFELWWQVVPGTLEGVQQKVKACYGVHTHA